jgi:hypothetical protein
LCREEVQPPFRAGFHGEDGAGRHIVHAYGIGEQIHEGRDAGIMGEEGDGGIVVVQLADYFFEGSRGSMVEFRKEMDVFVFFAVGAYKVFRGLAGPFGRALHETVDDKAGTDDPLGHGGGVPLSPVVKRAIDIAGVGIVPAAFCMPDYQ